MAKDSPIQFKGTSLQIIHAALRTTDIATLRIALEEMTGNAPDFFEEEPALLDFSAAEDLPEAADWPAIRALFSGSGLHAVATLGLPPELAAAAQAAGLPTVKSETLGRLARPVKAVETEVAAVAPVTAMPAEPMLEEPTPLAATTVTVDKPLRSGQRVYARGGDLVVLAMVSAGAEVIADGNIHVYAPLRGRALAGASGDRAARIFTTCLEAELVSVAGIYRTFEAGVPATLARQPATVSLVDGDGESRLEVAPLTLR